MIQHAIFGALACVIGFAFFEAFWPAILRGIKGVLLFPLILAGDIRRNGRDVLKAAFWWLVAIVAIASLTLLF
jgi:hypothetical protein